MKSFFELYIRISYGEDIVDLNDVLDGENGFERIILVDKEPKTTIDKATEEVLSTGVSHVFTEKVESEFGSFDFASGRANEIFTEYNNKICDICFKSSAVGSISTFVKGVRAAIKINGNAGQLSKVTITGYTECDDASDHVSFFAVGS